MGDEDNWFDNEDFWDSVGSYLFSELARESGVEQVDHLEQLLDPKSGSDILDLCCGVGRHSLELARRGYKVTGVDRTAGYLNQARREAEQAGLSVELVQSDMREFRRPDSYDMAINLFTSFGYFKDPDDDRRVAENVCMSLRKGGSFVIEMMGKEVLARIFRPRDWQRYEDGTIMLEERRLVDNWSYIENTWTVIRPDSRKNFTFRLRMYSACELSTLLLRSGFQHVEVYGHLSGTPYDQDAKRLVVVGRK